MFSDFLSNLENHHFLGQTAVTIFSATFEKLANFLIHHLVTLSSSQKMVVKTHSS